MIRKIRRGFEWLFGRWYEGPQVPDRLIQEVDFFMKWHPHATKGQWAHFAAGLSEASYKAGYMRGYEYVERQELSRKANPDMFADEMDPDWRDRPAARLELDELDAMQHVTDTDVLDVTNFRQR